ncbi:Uncharacterised protein [Vibrio cholerae]|nr:Uncharacterised protein [Vibrio cholerae]
MLWFISNLSFSDYIFLTCLIFPNGRMSFLTLCTQRVFLSHQSLK